MNGDAIIANGTVYREQGADQCDVLIRAGQIAGFGRRADFAADAEVYDARGCAVLPGMIDFHVHMDDTIGPWALADSFASGTKCGVLNGVTTVYSFVTQKPRRTLRAGIERAQDKVTGKAYGDVGFHLTPTTFADADWDEMTVLAERGFRTFKFYTTYKRAGLYQSYDALRDLFARCTRLGVRVLVHCEDEGLLTEAGSHDPVSAVPFTHALRRPKQAEIAAIERVAALAGETGAEVHIVHVSTAEGAQVIRRSTAALSCETAPQYLFLNDAALSGANGQAFICSPPLRDEANRREMQALAADGAFDIFATDHCAFRTADKMKPVTDVNDVPNGLAGIGALLPLTHQLLRGDWTEIWRRLARRPAELAGIFPRKGILRCGSDADVLVVSAGAETRPVRSSLADCMESYPLESTNLHMRLVMVRGHVVVRENALSDSDHPRGQVVCPL
jgi:dihydropyrimidinase